MSDIHVRLNGDGTNTVHVNGHEILGVQAVRVEGATAQIPVTTLKVAGPVEIEGIGTVQVAEPAPELDVLRELDAILADVDPSTLDREVLEGAGLGDLGGGAAEYLNAIRRYVRGD